MKHLPFFVGFLGLLLCGVLSTVLSMTADMEGSGLGGLVNMFLPGIIMLFSMIIFGICCLVVKKSKFRFVVLVITNAYLIYVGIALHFPKEYWPLLRW